MPLLQLFVKYAYIEVIDYLLRNVNSDTVTEQLIDWSLISKHIFGKRRYIFPDFTLIDYLEILKDVKIYDDATKNNTDYGDAITVLNTYWFIIGESIMDNRYYPYIIGEYTRLNHPMETD